MPHFLIVGEKTIQTYHSDLINDLNRHAVFKLVDMGTFCP